MNFSLLQQSTKTIFKISISTILLFLMTTPFADAERRIHTSKGQTIYVPIYSNIYAGERQRPYFLYAILSIRNIDIEKSITVTQVDYFDSNGKLIKHYLNSPVTLNPLASARYIVPESEKAGGSGANFIVKWHTSELANPPITESIMLTTRMSQGVSFITQGRAILEKE